MKQLFPRFALGIGVLLALVLVRYGPQYPDAGPALPLLTALLMSEFGFVVTAIAVAIGIREAMNTGLRLLNLLIPAGNLLLALIFLYLGLLLWPGGATPGL